jgi:hypothetical protein
MGDELGLSTIRCLVGGGEHPLRPEPIAVATNCCVHAFGYGAALCGTAAVNTLHDPNVRQKLEGQGFEIPPREQQTPEALGAYQKAEIEKWWPIIQAAGIKAE